VNDAARTKISFMRRKISMASRLFICVSNQIRAA
jgi:hypothetical protein